MKRTKHLQRSIERAEHLINAFGNQIAAQAEKAVQAAAETLLKGDDDE